MEFNGIWYGLFNIHTFSRIFQRELSFCLDILQIVLREFKILLEIHRGYCNIFLGHLLTIDFYTTG